MFIQGMYPGGSMLFIPGVAGGKKLIILAKWISGIGGPDVKSIQPPLQFCLIKMLTIAL